MIPLIVSLFLSASSTAKISWVTHLHECENRQNIEKWIDTNDKYSYGWLAYQRDTWLSYGKDYGATMENIQDSGLQTLVAISMLDKGETWHWKTCNKKVSAKYGPYPRDASTDN
jgi:hypothetical protein